MRLLRGARSLRTLESIGGFSRSQLSAYETARRLPPLEYAEALDQLYSANGWLALSIRTLRRGDWDPWRTDRSASYRHAFSWNAAYEGIVWIEIRPVDGAHYSVDHKILSEWGPWWRNDELQIAACGVVLVTGKAADPDGVAKTYNLTSNRAVFALSGFGEIPAGENILDIRQGWQLQP